MGFIEPEVFNKAKEILSKMTKPVKLILFKQAGNPLSDAFEALLAELAPANRLLSIEIHDYESEKELAAKYGVPGAGTLVMSGEKSFVSMAGLPTGYEFFSFLLTLVEVSKGEADLPPSFQQEIRAVDFPVDLKVFVTPECPYCPGAVRTAFMFAIINPKIRAQMIMSPDFPAMAEFYHVMGVPKTVINGKVELAGLYPPELVLKKIKESK